MGKDKPGGGKGFVQVAALILHESKLAICPEETSPAGRFFAEHRPKELTLIPSFKGETGGVRAIFIRPRKGRLELRVEMQDGRQFTATTSQKYTACFKEEQADNAERSE